MSVDAHPLVSDWLSQEGGRLVVRTGKVDIGQRISTALAQIVAEELGLPQDRIDVATVSTGASPDEGITSGSNSIEQSGHAVRLAAATLRALIIRAAVSSHGGSETDWSLENATLTRPGGNRPVPFFDLLKGMDLAVPIDPKARPVARTALPRAPMRGLAEMVSGRYVFLHDLDAPGMLHARNVRPPRPTARLRALAADVCESLEARGLRIVRDGSYVAVTGPEEWPVVKAAARLAATADWDMGDDLPETDIFDTLRPELALRMPVEDGIPRPGAALPPAIGATHAARYERPFTLHGALAPSAALAEWNGTRLRVVTHSQGIFPLRETLAEAFGLDLAHVTLTHAPGSGCYGHNGADDAAYEAALIARHLPGCPVLLKWSREEEHAWAPCGTAQAVEVAARVSAGRIEAISVDTIGGTFRGRPRPGPNGDGPARLLSRRYLAAPGRTYMPEANLNRHGGLHRNLDPAYAIPEQRLVKNLVRDMPLRTSALRCLGAAANVFALESFLDEIALDAGLPPATLRKDHLDDPRALAVLDRLLSELGPKTEGTGRGIAYARYKNQMARVAVAADLTVTDAAEIRLRRLVIAADAGRVVEANGLEAQLEGGALQAASWALHEAVTHDRDGITSRDWESYPVLRFDTLPDIDVHLVDRPDDPPLGAGEAAPGPTLAAIANALHDATGLRLRRLPFTPDALRQAALDA